MEAAQPEEDDQKEWRTIDEVSAYIFKLVRGREAHPEEIAILSAGAQRAVEHGFDYGSEADQAAIQELQAIATKYGLSST